MTASRSWFLRLLAIAACLLTLATAVGASAQPWPAQIDDSANEDASATGIPGGLTADQVAAAAVANSPDLAARRADVRAAAAGVRQALDGYIPHVKLTARYTQLSGIDAPSLGEIVVAPSAPVGLLPPGTPLVNVPLAFATKPIAAPVKVPLVLAAEAPTPDFLTLTGELAADQRSEIAAETQGRVIALFAQRGQRVKRGEALVTLDVRSAALTAREAQANLDAARSERHLAEQECARSASLYASGAITKSEADREAGRCEAALSHVAGAEARAALVAKGVTDGIVRAPFDGVIASRTVAVGEWVAPGRPLFTIIDGGPLEVELAVPEANVPAIHLGQAVELTAIAHPAVYAATVTRLGAEIGPSRSLTVEATVAPTPDLLPGMFVTAHVVIGHTARPVVPEAAVVQRGKTWHAFVAVSGVLEERVVKLGPRLGAGRVSILRGLTRTDRVVQAVTDQIVDGLAVE